MVKSKLAVVALLVLIVLMFGVLMVEFDKTAMLKEMRAIMRNDSNCCQMYRNPMMPFVCSLNITDPYKNSHNDTYEPLNVTFPTSKTIAP